MTLIKSAGKEVIKMTDDDLQIIFLSKTYAITYIFEKETEYITDVFYGENADKVYKAARDYYERIANADTDDINSDIEKAIHCYLETTDTAYFGIDEGE